MTNAFDLYWQDLTEECQQRLLEFLGGENGNYNTFPICTLEFEEEEEDA